MNPLHESLSGLQTHYLICCFSPLHVFPSACQQIRAISSSVASTQNVNWIKVACPAVSVPLDTLARVIACPAVSVRVGKFLLCSPCLPSFHHVYQRVCEFLTERRQTKCLSLRMSHERKKEKTTRDDFCTRFYSSHQTMINAASLLPSMITNLPLLFRSLLIDIAFFACKTHTDIDECTTSLKACGPNAACRNTPGSFECICPYSFIGDPYSGCEAAGTVSILCPLSNQMISDVGKENVCSECTE